jgi:hypothetical protein
LVVICVLALPRPITLAHDQPKPARGVNPNTFFATLAGPDSPEIAVAAVLPVHALLPIVAFDFTTTAGAT